MIRRNVMGDIDQILLFFFYPNHDHNMLVTNVKKELPCLDEHKHTKTQNLCKTLPERKCYYKAQ